MNRKNIIYMHTHDSGRYWSPYGYALPTPNLMELAEESVLFRHCYCAAPTCSPSRAGLLTGMCAHSSGMLGLAHRGFKLSDYSKHMVSFLNQHDYCTALCGIQHVAQKYEMIGYQHIVGTQDFCMDATELSMEEWDYANTKEACAFIENYDNKKPLFLSMGWFNTHREYPKVKEDINPDYLAPPLPLYDCDLVRKDMAGYHESVRVVDNCVGSIMASLKKSGMDDNTIVIMTTDHGIAFPKMKCTLHDTGIGVGLMIKYPGNPQKGKAIDALVSQIDIFPTLCDMIGAEKPHWLQGTSMMPVLEKRSDKIREEIFSEVTYHAAYEPKRCIRTERYKLIRLYDHHDGYVPANIDECPSKDFLLDNGDRGKTREKEYLFDLWLDAYEKENVIDNPEYTDIRRELSNRLSEWMERTDDPILKYGYRVPKPAGARVNKLTCENPRHPDFED